MRLSKLTMQGFGSYADKTTIDFSAPQQNLFLVTGDTGAGKSTIFDAITFALFGERSSSESKGGASSLRSHYAQEKAPVSVELSFTIGDGEDQKEYCVRRVLPKPRVSRKANAAAGRNVNLQAELTAGDEESTVTGSKAVTARVQELLGLNKNQFSQVAMIAQGEFVELIRMSSSERKKIFSELFHTGIYGEIVQELRERQQSCTEKRKRILERVRGAAFSVQAPEAYPALEEFRQIQQALSEESVTALTVEAYAKTAAALADWLQVSAAKAGKTAEAASEAGTKAHRLAGEAETLSRQFVQLERARTRAAEVELKKPAMDEQRELAVRLERAYRLQALHAEMEKARGDKAETELRIAEDEKRLPDLANALDSAKIEERAAREQYNAVRPSAEAEKNSAYAARKVFDEIDEAVRELGRLEAEHAQARREEKEAAAGAERTAQQLSQMEAKLEAAKASGIQAEKISFQLSQAEAAAADAVLLNERCLAAEQCRHKLKNASRALNAATTKLQRLQRDYMALEDAYYSSQAGVLASRLKPGTPCPVCGSVEHPSPHLAAGEESPKQADLDRRRQEVRKAEDHRTDSSSEHAKQAAKLESAEKDAAEALARARTALGKCWPDEDIPEKPKQLLEFAQSRAEKIRERKQVLETQAAAAPQLATRIRELEEQCGKARQNAEEIRAEKDKREKAVFVAGERIKDLKTRVKYASPEEADEAARRADKNLTEAADALERAQQAREQAASTIQSVRSAIEANKLSLRSRTRALEERSGAYMEVLSEEQMSEQEWQNLAASNDRQDLARCRESLLEFDREAASAEGELRACEKAVEGRAKPDLESIQAAARDADERARQAQNAFSALQQNEQTVQKSLRSVCAQLADLQKLGKQYDVLSELDRKMNARTAHIDLETYAQRYYLERVLEAANRHLRRMTGGEYTLRLLSPEDIGGGGNQGLELGVHSAVTGMVRHAKTLSGGETFMAALSLALGMADQIEANASAVHMDMMFVDEGFGALDDETCREAVNMLQEATGSSRLVGVISHVPALKQMIGDQLIVTKNETGSSARWEQFS